MTKAESNFYHGLLLDYIEAESSVIGEFSGNFKESYTWLYKKAMLYCDKAPVRCTNREKVFEKIKEIKDYYLDEVTE